MQFYFALFQVSVAELPLSEKNKRTLNDTENNLSVKVCTPGVFEPFAIIAINSLFIFFDF